jgi:hypothetical protein
MALNLGRSSQVAEVETPRLGRGSFGGACAGVADEHVGAGPAGDRHQPGFGAAGGEPAVGGGVPESVRPEPVDSRARSPATKRPAESHWQPVNPIATARKIELGGACEVWSGPA